MPLIVLSGQPASGKSTVAAKLRTLLEPEHAVVLIDEPTLHLQRNEAYKSSLDEKNTRGALKSAVDRAVSKTSYVILDSINNIKGYRYELWCLARAVGTRYCMVHVDTPVDTCRNWNSARDEDSRYTTEVLEDLLRRFETPDSRNRWDAPLFTVRPGSGEEGEVLASIVAAVTDAPAADPTQVAAKELQPTFATTNPSLLGTNLLHDIDRAAQEVVDAVVEAQTAAGGGAAGRVGLGAAGQLNLCTPVSLAELRRHKRAFLKLATKITFARLQDAAAAQRLFVDHLRQQLAAAPG